MLRAAHGLCLSGGRLRPSASSPVALAPARRRLPPVALAGLWGCCGVLRRPAHLWCCSRVFCRFGVSSIACHTVPTRLQNDLHVYYPIVRVQGCVLLMNAGDVPALYATALRARCGVSAGDSLADACPRTSVIQASRATSWPSSSLGPVPQCLRLGILSRVALLLYGRVSGCRRHRRELPLFCPASDCVGALYEPVPTISFFLRHAEVGPGFAVRASCRCLTTGHSASCLVRGGQLHCIPRFPFATLLAPVVTATIADSVQLSLVLFAVSHCLTSSACISS